MKHTFGAGLIVLSVSFALSHFFYLSDNTSFLLPSQSLDKGNGCLGKVGRWPDGPAPDASSCAPWAELHFLRQEAIHSNSESKVGERIPHLKTKLVIKDGIVGEGLLSLSSASY